MAGSTPFEPTPSRRADPGLFDKAGSPTPTPARPTQPLACSQHPLRLARTVTLSDDLDAFDKPPSPRTVSSFGLRQFLLSLPSWLAPPPSNQQWRLGRQVDLESSRCRCRGGRKGLGNATSKGVYALSHRCSFVVGGIRSGRSKPPPVDPPSSSPWPPWPPPGNGSTKST